MSDTGTRSIQRKLQDNIRRVRDRIAEACHRANRPEDSVRLVAVTKSVEMDVIRMGLDLGLTDLGENRVQHLGKRAAMVRETVKRRRILEGDQNATGPTWHMIGHLQRNKVKPVLQWSHIIHSVDSLRLAEEINDVAQNLQMVADIYLQVNVSGERSKFGLAVGAVDVVAEQVRAMEFARLVGLMTMAPEVPDPELVRPEFRRLREIAEDLKERGVFEGGGGELSMGMSSDFEVAVEEGATVVRIGSALFQGLERGVVA